jgi:hypothetical protein
MNSNPVNSILFPRQLAIFLLAFAIGIPVLAQEAQPAAPPQDNPPSMAQQQPLASPSPSAAKEGFWGRVNPFARKKWVRRQTDPINDRLGELDQVNAKNARDIQDVDSRAQAGIRRVQSRADAANQAALAADARARQAGTTAQGAAGHVDELNGTVNGLDQFQQVTETEVVFHGGQPILSAEARRRLDKLAGSLSGQHGYILEMEARSPLSGSAGIQSSARLGEAVKRYLVTRHEIPVYRLHTVALGNARGEEQNGDRPTHTNSVRIRLMENSLAAQQATHEIGSSSDVDRP